MKLSLPFSILIIICSSISLCADPDFPVQIKTLIYIADVREIDGARQSFSADVFIRLKWFDQSLASAEPRRVIPLTSAWHPNVQVVNRITAQSAFPEMLEVDTQGNVTFRQRLIGQFSCVMNLAEFPLDRQLFTIRLVSLGFTPEQIQFVSDVDSLKPANFSITDWRVISWKSADEVYSVSGIQNLPGYQYSFTAQRQFYFFLVQIILPMTLILGMSWIVFWLDHNQPGPRISISITAMLTLVAYRLMLGNFIPRLAYLTRMDYFVFLCTFLVFLSLVSVVVISRLVIQQKETIATKLDKSCRWVFPSLFAVVLIVCFVL